MRYEFHPEALAEYGHAARYYADCQEGLELRFMAAVEHAIHQNLVNAAITGLGATERRSFAHLPPGPQPPESSATATPEAG